MVSKANFLLLSNPTLSLASRQFSRNLSTRTWQQLKTVGITPDRYTTLACLTGTGSSEIPEKWPIVEAEACRYVFLEVYQGRSINTFLDAQELTPVSFHTAEDRELVLSKLKSAFSIIDKVLPIASDVKNFVQNIIVLHSPDPEIDISYSHPNIPFSIFVSTGEEISDIMSMRVAESIIHEAMHLKLSMFEAEVPLVETNQDARLYSPWRLELRPVQGVLHGLFVFRMLYEFYKALREVYQNQEEPLYFIEDRMKNIINEMREVNDLMANEALTDKGRLLASRLLKVKLT